MSGPERPLVLLFTDSLGMPRDFLPPRDRTTYEQTYPAIVRGLLADRADVEVVSSIGLDSQAAVYWAKFQVYPRRPTVLVLHLGVVDCAPRVFKKDSPSILVRPWFLRLTRGYTIRLIHELRPLICRLRKLVYVGEEEFERNLAELRDRVAALRTDSRILAVAISDKPKRLEWRSPGYRANVARYNRALQRVFGAGFVDVNSLLPLEDQLISDGIHLTPQAHELLAGALAERVEAALSAQGERAAPASG
jgi:lysophospholipase L1-like esterase